jgi:hypothetical protein
MESFPWGDNTESQPDSLSTGSHRNDSGSDVTTNARSREDNTALSPAPREYDRVEDIIAIAGAIPSSILTYISIYCSDIPSTHVFPLVVAIAVSVTMALFSNALKLLVEYNRNGRLD